MEQVVLDLIPAGAKGVCHVSQNDIGRTIRFNLVSGGTVYTLSGTETIKVFIKKPDGTTSERNIANTSSTYVDWVTGEGDCDVAGKNECELVITAGTTVIGSKNFTMKVEEDPYNGQGVVIETAGPAAVASFNTNIIDLFVEIKCEINAIQEGTPWIDSNVIEKEPYNFRKVAGTAARIGNHLFDKLVGVSVAWNQLAPNNYNPSTVSEIMFNSGVTITAGHKYFMSRKLGSAQNVADAVYAKIDGANVLCFQITAQNTETVVQSTYSGKAAVASYIEGAVWIYHNSAVPVTDLNIFDLTAMFGSTIADYIYSLEQATAGAGVAFFRKLFPKNYYAFDDGSTKSVKTTAHVMRGFNVFDEVTQLGYWNGTTGVFVSNPNELASVNYMPVVPNTAYYFRKSGSSTTGDIIFFDANKNFIGYRGGVGKNAITLPNNCHFIQINIGNDYGTTYKNDICINISDTNRNGEYEPYTAHNYALDDVELRGIFKLDSNNKLYADGDTYESSGDVTRKYIKYTITGNENVSTWVDNTSGYFAGHYGGEINVPNFPIKTGANNVGIVNKIYQVKFANADKTVYCSAQNRIAIINDDYHTQADWLAAITGLEIVMELATPTTETADPFTNPQQVDANGTEEYVDSRSPAIPVGHETYYADIYEITGFTACKISIKDGTNVERKSATIQFGQTVYGGYLEYKNGAWVFTGTSRCVNIPDVDWVRGNRNNADTGRIFYYRFVENSPKNRAALMCEMFQDAETYQGTWENMSANTMQADYSKYIEICADCDTVAEFKAYCSGRHLVYELATPFTLTLTGAQLETLLGENRVSHNCNGDTEVKYLYNA